MAVKKTANLLTTELQICFQITVQLSSRSAKTGCRSTQASNSHPSIPFNSFPILPSLLLASPPRDVVHPSYKKLPFFFLFSFSL